MFYNLHADHHKSVSEDSPWRWCEKVSLLAAASLPQGTEISIFRALLQRFIPTLIHGWCIFDGTTGVQLHSLPFQEGGAFSLAHTKGRKQCEEHHSRQQ